MTYRSEIYTNNKEMQKYFDKLMRESVVVLPPRLAMDVGRHKTIQYIRNLDRKNPYFLITRDQKYHISILKIREPVKITKKGDNRYIFNL